jgi:Rrf2 family iron-sulfur cluster assembly transcriptional regulator
MKVSSTKARASVIAMVELANRQGKEDLVSLFDLATLQHKSKSYLEPLFKKLKAAGLVESQKGPGGGYRTKDTKTITAAAIITAITGDEIDPDPIWCELSGRVSNDLSKVTLFDLSR